MQYKQQASKQHCVETYTTDVPVRVKRLQPVVCTCMSYINGYFRAISDFLPIVVNSQRRIPNDHLKRKQ